MTRLRIASLSMAVVAGDYALLRLAYGQLTDFAIAAAVCAGSLITSGLIVHADNRRRQAMERGRAVVWHRRDQEAAIAAGQQCPMCGGASQEPSESPRFVDRQLARLCEGCASALNLGPTR
jgi:hypothetical protein